MNTMEITKYVGAFCGSLLVFLLITTAASSIYNTSSDVVAFSVEIPESTAEAAPEEAPAEAVDVATLVAAADPGAGETVFRKCSACHKVDGSDGVGPHLNGVVGRPVGAIEGYSYSDSLAGHGGAWDAGELYAFLENPKGYAPGTKMAFAGLAKSEERANVIAYLETTAP